MANYNARLRTNYFSVTDEDKFRDIVEKTGAEVFESDSGDGKFALASDDTITSYYDEELDESVEIIEELQEVLVDGDAIIVTEIGHEKYRYLVGYSIIITKQDVKTIDLASASIALASEMLGKPFITTMDY